MVILGETNTTVGVFAVGIFSDLSSLVFYAFPLSLMWDIIKTNDSSPLYGPAIMANLLNCLLWFSYGVWAINDPKVWVVNFLGSVLCILELIVWCNVPAQHTRYHRSDSLYGIGLSSSYEKAALPTSEQLKDIEAAGEEARFRARSKSSSTLSKKGDSEHVFSSIHTT